MIHSLADLTQNPDLTRPPAVRVEPCAVAGRVGLVCLGPKGGKSSTVAAMLATGSRHGVRGLLVTLDEALADSVRRLVHFGADPEKVFVAASWDPASIASDIVAHRIEFLCLDHLGKIAEQHPDFGPGSAGDAILWGRLVAPFTDLARTHDLAILLLDQARRSDGRYAGSTAKAGSVDFLVELEPKDGGLFATPRGRIVLPPFRADLDSDGRPVFTVEGTGAGPDAAGGADLPEKAAELLRLLADAEPEGLSSSQWRKLSGVAETTYHRDRRKLLRGGLALDPSVTRTRRYRVTDRGEAWLSKGATTAMAVPSGCHGSATHAKQLVELLAGSTNRTDPAPPEEDSDFLARLDAEVRSNAVAAP